MNKQNPNIKSQQSSEINWDKVSLKHSDQETYVEGVFFSTCSRYMAGRSKTMPAFKVIQPQSSNDQIKEVIIPIPSLGYRKAWKQALLTLTAHQGNSGRRVVVRYLHRPPKLTQYLV